MNQIVDEGGKVRADDDVADDGLVALVPDLADVDEDGVLVRGEDVVDGVLVHRELLEEVLALGVLALEDVGELDEALAPVGERLVVLADDEVVLAVVQAHEVLDGPLVQRVERVVPEPVKVGRFAVAVPLDGLSALVPQPGILNEFLNNSYLTCFIFILFINLP